MTYPVTCTSYMEEGGGYCYGSFAYTRTLDLSDSAKACAVLKAVSHLQDFLTTTILLSHFFFSDSFLYVRHV